MGIYSQYGTTRLHKLVVCPPHCPGYSTQGGVDIRGRKGCAQRRPAGSVSYRRRYNSMYRGTYCTSKIPWMDDGWRGTVLYMVQSIIPRRAQAQSGPSKYIDGPSESGMKLFTTIGPVGADADADACPTSIATDVRPVLFSSALPESNGTRSAPDRA